MTVLKSSREAAQRHEKAKLELTSQVLSLEARRDSDMAALDESTKDRAVLASEYENLQAQMKDRIADNKGSQGVAAAADHVTLTHEYERVKSALGESLSEVKQAQHEILELEAINQAKDEDYNRAVAQHEAERDQAQLATTARLEQIERRCQKQAGLDNQSVVDAVLAEKVEVQAQLKRVQAHLKRSTNETALNQAEIGRLKVAAKGDARIMREKTAQIAALEAQRASDVNAMDESTALGSRFHTEYEHLQAKMKEMIADNRGSQERVAALSSLLGERDDRIKALADQSKAKSAEFEEARAVLKRELKAARAETRPPCVEEASIEIEMAGGSEALLASAATTDAGGEKARLRAHRTALGLETGGLSGPVVGLGSLEAPLSWL